MIIGKLLNFPKIKFSYLKNRDNSDSDDDEDNDIVLHEDLEGYMRSSL